MLQHFFFPSNLRLSFYDETALQVWKMQVLLQQADRKCLVVQKPLQGKSGLKKDVLIKAFKTWYELVKHMPLSVGHWWILRDKASPVCEVNRLVFLFALFCLSLPPFSYNWMVCNISQLASNQTPLTTNIIFIT